MTISMTREALLARLNDRLAVAIREDERIKKEHAIDEKKSLAIFRNKLREAMKWDYAKLKAMGFSVGLNYDDRPKCPRSESDKIAAVIRSVEYDTRKRPFRIDAELYAAINYLPLAERPKLDMC